VAGRSIQNKRKYKALQRKSRKKEA